MLHTIQLCTCTCTVGANKNVNTIARNEKSTKTKTKCEQNGNKTIKWKHETKQNLSKKQKTENGNQRAHM